MSSPSQIAAAPHSQYRLMLWVWVVLIWLAGLLPLIMILLFDAGMGWVIYLIRQEVVHGFCGQSVVSTLTHSGYNGVRIALVLLALGFWLSCLLLTCRWTKSPETQRWDQWLAIGAVYVVSLGVVLTQTPSLLATGAYWRVHLAAPKFHAIAQDLFDDWPDQILEHPRLGTVGPHPDNLNRMFLLSRHGNSLDFRDDLGVGISRDPTGDALDIELDTYLLNNTMSRVIVMKSPNEIPVEELLRSLRIDRSRCHRIDSRTFFVP